MNTGRYSDNVGLVAEWFQSDRQEIHEHDAGEWAIGEKRLKILSELAGNERAGTKAIDAAARDLGIQRTQCSELLKRYWRCPTDRG